jgi:hypothetical protein
MQRNFYSHLLLAALGRQVAKPLTKLTGHHLPAGDASYGLMRMTLAARQWPSWRPSC